MPLYDFRCTYDETVVEDIYATSSKELSVKCPCCERQMVWKPYVRTQSTKAPFFCEQAGRKFHNYAELDRWAKANDKTIVPTSEHERSNFNRPNYEERITAERPKLKEAIKKAHYRLKNKYVDHKPLEKE